MGQISPGLVSHAAASGHAECPTTFWTQSLVHVPNSLLCVINARHRAVRALLPSGLEPPRCARLMTTLRSCYLPAMGPVPGNQSPRPGEPRSAPVAKGMVQNRGDREAVTSHQTPPRRQFWRRDSGSGTRAPWHFSVSHSSSFPSPSRNDLYDNLSVPYESVCALFIFLKATFKSGRGLAYIVVF